MRKIFTKLIGATLGLAMAVGVGVGVAANNRAATGLDATNSTTTMTWADGAFSYSASGDTYLDFTCTEAAVQTDDLRLYAGNEFTISAKSIYSSTVKIKQLDVTGKSSKNSNVLRYDTETGTKVDSDYEEATWSTSSAERTMSFGSTGFSSVTVWRADSGNQVRVTQIVVTYEYTPVSVVEATSMSISPAGPASLVVGDTLTFTPTLSGGSGLYERTIEWVSSSTDVVAKPEDSEDGESVTITALAAGSTTITGTVVSPGSATASIVIGVKAVASIAITTPPTKTTYIDGESFDPAGMVVTATYSDSTTDDVTASCEYSTDPLTYGSTSITVSFGGKSATQTIVVNAAQVKTDVLTGDDGEATNTTYKTKTNVAKNSAARYTMTNNISSSKLNFRTDNEDSGIVSTISGGTIKTVSVDGCSASRTIEVYGSNTAYTAPTNLFDAELQGTKLGELSSTTTSLAVVGNYAYVGVRSQDKAVNMNSISFVWNVPFPESVTSVALPTKTSLSYSYTEDGGNYEYSNVVVRFAGLISTSQWGEIDTGSHLIQGYGILFTTAAFIGDQTIKSLYNVTRNGRTVDAALTQLCYENSVRNFYRPLSEKASPDTANDIQKGGAAGDHYIWYLSKTVTENLTASYTAVAYIRVANDIVFLNEVTASAKSVAHDLIESGAYDSGAAGGSLNYLAHLS